MALIWTINSHALHPRVTKNKADCDNSIIRRILISSKTVTTLAGRRGVSAPFSDGVGAFATFNFPDGVAMNADGTIALVVRLVWEARVHTPTQRWITVGV